MTPLRSDEQYQQDLREDCEKFIERIRESQERTAQRLVAARAAITKSFEMLRDLNGGGAGRESRNGTRVTS